MSIYGDRAKEVFKDLELLNKYDLFDDKILTQKAYEEFDDEITKKNVYTLQYEDYQIFIYNLRRSVLMGEAIMIERRLKNESNRSKQF